MRGSTWSLLLAATLALPVTARGDWPGWVRRLETCPTEGSGPASVGWCSEGDTYALAHVGSLAFAGARKDVHAILQAALLARTEGKHRGLLQLNAVTVVDGGARVLLRAGLFGQVTGDDLTLVAAGVANRALEDPSGNGTSAGLRLAILANDTGRMWGAQLAFLLNRATQLRGLQAGVVVNEAKEVRGAQLHVGATLAYATLATRLAETGEIDGYRDTWALIGLLLSGINRAGDLRGLQLGGWLNQVDGDAMGIQLGAVNLATNVSGAQLGVFNRVAGKASGLQLGLVNFARELHGVQVGVLNVAWNSRLPITTIINAAW